MRRVGVVACSARKANGIGTARDLYRGDLFRKSRRYCERHCDEWIILSARWGVVEPDEWLEPYDQRLPGSKRERAGWTAQVAAELQARYSSDVTFVLLCGRQYAEAVEATGYRIERPLAGCRGIGEMLRWLKLKGQRDE